MSNKTLCSVCIANYNGEQYLVECIKSIQSQNFDYPVEILVHDDASIDGSVDLIKREFPEITLIVSEENVGFCISNNRMVKKAHGKYILLLNNDATLFPDALDTLYRAGISKGDGIYGLPQYDAETGVLIDLGSCLDIFHNPIPNLDRTREDVGMIIGACFWLPKDLWVQLGGFPEWFETLAEDMYLSCLARLSGYHVKCLNVSGFSHHVGKNLGGGKVLDSKRLSTTVRRRSLSERNKTYVMLTCLPVPAVIFVFPVHVFLLFIEGGLLLIIKKQIKIWTDIYWHCFKSIWKHKGLIRKTRRKNQALREVSLLTYMKPFTLIPHKARMLIRYGIPYIER